MMTAKTIKPPKCDSFLDQLNNGNEKALAHFYGLLYPRLSWWAHRRVKDEVAATSIAQEAFLKLWQLREKIKDFTHLISFLEKQIRQGCSDFYEKTSVRFQRGMIRLDDIENYQEFIGGYDPRTEIEDIPIFQQEEMEKEQQEQWAAVEKLLPNLSQEQQLFIRLCLRFSFNYDRIAWHLGGISDYEVGLKVEKSITALKSIIMDTKKLEVTAKARSFSFEGEISEAQAQILNLRYEMQYSFAEIAAELGLSQVDVQRNFVQAYRTLKKS
jgi:RNA polymerase sigma factor (sigma-70 family)